MTLILGACSGEDDRSSGPSATTSTAPPAAATTSPPDPVGPVGTTTATSTSVQATDIEPRRMPQLFPYVLVTAQDWELTDFYNDWADDDHRHPSATMSFQRSRPNVAQLWMNLADQAFFDQLVDDRQASATTRLADASALGVPALVFAYPVVYPAAHDHAAIWRADGVVFEMRTDVDENTLRELLNTLSYLDEDEWLTALPESVATDGPTAMRAMLGELPLPVGFDIDRVVAEAPTIQSRYHLGVEVVLTLLCSWVDQWSVALASDDSRAAEAAIDAIRSTPHWPILQEMAEAGGLSDHVWRSARMLNANDSPEQFALQIDPNACMTP